MIQTSIVALLVLGSSAYAAWSLMPAVARRALARKLLELPLPRRLAGAMRKHASDAGGCACDGCGRSSTASTKMQPSAPAPIRFHPRVRR